MTPEAIVVVQLSLGAVFVFSSVAKLRDPVAFAKGVTEYDILPPGIASSVAIVIVPLECYLAVGHLSGWSLNVAAPLGLVALIAFTFAVVITLRRGRMVPCHCFGSSSREFVSWRTLARLVLMLAGELSLLSGAATSAAPTLSLGEWCLAVVWATFLLIAASWLLSVDHIVYLFRSCHTCASQGTQQLQEGVR